MEDKEITLKLSISEVNMVLDALSERPYKDVFQLVAKIQHQGNEQVESNE